MPFRLHPLFFRLMNQKKNKMLLVFLQVALCRPSKPCGAIKPVRAGHLRPGVPGIPGAQAGALPVGMEATGRARAARVTERVAARVTART